jgi:glycosyltransferase involved in cell wall biosynthesis
MNNNPPELTVSVIIPVFNDAHRLTICLEALENQTYPKESYQVVVVDNGSKEDISNLVGQFSQSVLAHEARPGSYAARNKGISVSKGEVLAFTDSDCIPSVDWIENGVEAIRISPDCGLVAGKIEMFFRNPGRLTAVELYEKIYAFDQRDNVQIKKYGVTANLFARRKVFDTVGLFDATLKSGGDLEWGNRVWDAGYALIYADQVCVAHPARHSLRQLYKKRVRVLGGINAINENPSYNLSNALTDLKNISIYTLWLTRSLIKGMPPSEKFENARQKAQYLFVFPYVRVISIFEKWRLHVGGKTSR